VCLRGCVCGAMGITNAFMHRTELTADRCSWQLRMLVGWPFRGFRLLRHAHIFLSMPLGRSKLRPSQILCQA